MNYRRKRFKSNKQRKLNSERSKRGWQTRRTNGNATWGIVRDEPVRIREGEFLGVLEWRGVDGSVRKVVVRQAKRANSIHIDGMNKSVGWDTLFRDIRSKLSLSKKTTLC